MLESTGYRRANCRHGDGDATVTALLTCSAVPAVSSPLAQFRTFASVDDLRSFYTGIVLKTFRTDGCAGSGPGVDAASVVDGKEVGRKTCYDDLTVSPSDPKPVLVITNETSRALAIFIWDSAAEKPLRDYAARHDNHWQFAAPGKGDDPDAFTAADRAIFAHLGEPYTTRTCAHYTPPAGAVATAILGCGGPLGSPGVTFYGYAERRLANNLYQGQLGQLPGHACGGGGGSDDVWRKSGGPVGRLTCYTDANFDPARPCLLAVHEEHMSTIIICALASDSPEQGPKTEAELSAWFQRRFGTG